MTPPSISPLLTLAIMDAAIMAAPRYVQRSDVFEWYTFTRNSRRALRALLADAAKKELDL